MIQLTDTRRKILLAVVLVAVAVSIWYLDDSGFIRPNADIASTGSTETITQKETLYPRAKELVNPQGFINSEPFQIADHIGKQVILVDFWTYSCINCVRTQPYLNAWQEKYGDQGLLIIGVHTPEFEFEKVRENVEAAARDAGITYPVVQDNDYETWRAYQNRYWPRKYLIDIDGFIVYDHIGEGGYEETEHQIQQALAERAQRLGTEMEFDVALAQSQPETYTDGNPRTPEIYFGAWRNANYLGNGRGSTEGEQAFAVPTTPVQNHFYLDGQWDIEYEYAENTEAGARIVLPFQARDVYMVAGDMDMQGNVVTVLLDGKPVTPENAGAHVQDSVVEVQEQTLYRLIELPQWGEHTLELIIENPGLQAFTFTFG